MTKGVSMKIKIKRTPYYHWAIYGSNSYFGLRICFGWYYIIFEH